MRPTDPTRRPEHVRKFLKEDQWKLYELIWQRFMASQMSPAIFDTTTIDFEFDRFLFRATGSVVKFDGYQKLYKESREAEEAKPLEAEQGLPSVQKGEEIPVKAITPSQHFTEPPPRYSEASLVKELERLGIGRPSTYASIVSTLVDRRYANLEQRRFYPTPLGEQVEKVMVKSFPDVFNVRFTSHMETDLDKVEEGDVNWRKMLKDFYGPFDKSVKGADIAVRRSKWRGKAFYGCSNYPRCDFVVWDKPVAETCPECGYVGAEAKFTKTRGDYRRCIKCANEWDVAPAPEPEAVAV